MNWHGCCPGTASTSELGEGRVVASRTRWVVATGGGRFGVTTGGDGGAVLSFFGGCCTLALLRCG